MAGIETGYETRFDFPRRADAPALVYLLASVPRSGSTYVSHLLWRCGCLGAPLEYLNFEPGGPHGFAHGAPTAQSRLWDEILARRTGPNGVFGLKTFPEQMQALQDTNPALLARVMRTLIPGRGQGRVVQLRRRDRTAHAISYARAALSGIWRSEQEIGGRPEPAYSERAVINAGLSIDQQERVWQAMYRDLDLRPLVLCYEDVLADPAGAVAAVAAHLGVALDPAAAVDIPEIARQSQTGAKVWREAHDRQAGEGREPLPPPHSPRAS